MTQQPFSRPGAVDLSGLNRPACAHVRRAGRVARGELATRARRTPWTSASRTSRRVLESSVTAPVVLVFYSPSRVPESTAYADEVAAAIDAYDGRFLAGLVDIDAAPAIAQSLQIPQVPLLMVILDGRPAAQPIPGVLKLDEIDTAAQPARAGAHRAGHHRRGTSRSPPRRRRRRGRRDEEQVDPRYAAPSRRWRTTTSTAPSRSTSASSTPTPPTPRRRPGWRWPRCCSAPRASTWTPPARPPRRTPTTSTPRPWWPTSTCSAGTSTTPSPAWSTWSGVRAGDERNQAREHLLGLFAAVGNDDPRVLRGRQNLASALF